MPRKRETNDTKALRGTNRTDRGTSNLVALPKPAELPEAPEWVSEGAARDEFNRIAGHLHEAGSLTELSVVPLGHLASLHATLARHWAHEMTPPSALLSQYRLLAQEFGLTPAMATRLPTPPKPRENRFAQRGRPPA